MAEPVTNVLGIVGIKHCGEYDATKNYEKLNVVTYNGSSYCAKTSTTGNLPTNTDFWDLMAEKGDKGDTGEEGYTPVKGTDYYTAADKAELETTLSSDVTTEVTSQLGSLTSATPLAASSTSGMTDTTRIYVNTTDGHWYWHNGSAWTDGGVYQATGIGDNSVSVRHLNKSICGTKFHYQAETETNIPVIKFLLLNNFDMGDLTSLGLKAKFTNNLDVKLGNGTFAVNFSKTGFGQGFSFTDVFPNNPEPHGSIEINSSKNATSQWTGVKPTHISFKLDMGTSRLYNFDIENIEFYINGNKLEYGKDFDFDSSIATQTDISDDVDYLVSKNQLKETKNEISNLSDEITELREDIPSQEELSILKNYDTATKSDLHKITCWGDSITAGAYPSDLQSLVNDRTTVTNRGHAGESSGTIAFRQGGLRLYTDEDITIPADRTGVAFKYDSNIGGISGTGRLNLTVTIAGVVGKAVHSWTQERGHILTFTRAETGSAVNVPSGTEIFYATQNTANDDVCIFWSGRNDVAFGGGAVYSVPAVKNNTIAMVNNLSPQIKRFLVLSTTTTTDEYEGGTYQANYRNVLAINEALKNEFPNNYVDILDYLINQCIYDMGITPTEEDLLNISRGTVPPSIMNSDGIHPLPSTYEYIARYLYNVLNSKGWIL